MTTTTTNTAATALRTYETLRSGKSTDRDAWYRAAKALLIASYHAPVDVAAQLADRAELARRRACE